MTRGNQPFQWFCGWLASLCIHIFVIALAATTHMGMFCDASRLCRQTITIRKESCLVGVQAAWMSIQQRFTFCTGNEQKGCETYWKQQFQWAKPIQTKHPTRIHPSSVREICLRQNFGSAWQRKRGWRPMRSGQPGKIFFFFCQTKVVIFHKQNPKGKDLQPNSVKVRWSSCFFRHSEAILNALRLASVESKGKICRYTILTSTPATGTAICSLYKGPID